MSRIAREAGIADAQLFALTAGNPFLVTEVVECGAQEVPPSAREAVLARVARLSPDARKTLEAAAVIGSRVEVALLRKAANAPSGLDSADAIDECLTAGALLSEPDGFRFRHEIARRAVEEALPAHRRTELHQSVLNLLMGIQMPALAEAVIFGERAGLPRDKILQMIWCEDKRDWYRFWEGPEMIAFRRRHSGHFQIPVTYIWHDEIAAGALGPDVALEPAQPEPEPEPQATA